MDSLADTLGLSGLDREAFAEVYQALGARGAKSAAQYLAKVRSNAEVNARIAELNRPAEGSSAHERLLFCGRYSAKAGTGLDDALHAAADGLARAEDLRARLGSRKLRLVISAGQWGDEHKAARAAAFPYSPSVSATYGSPVIEARSAEGVEAHVETNQLLGYVAMQGGGYVDDIAVFPEVQGQGVASSLLAAAASLERGHTMSLDVRAANVPALRLYEALGFRFGTLQHPGFLDWDGGYEGAADAATVAAKLPPNADVSRLR